MIDFSVIPTGEAFELLCEDILRELSLHIVEKVSRGPDLGKDIIAEWVQNDVLNIKETHRYLVECKHHARGKRKASVKESEVGSIVQRMGTHKCDRYLLITSTLPTEKVQRQVNGIKNTVPGFQGIIWSANDLVRILEEKPAIWFRHTSPSLTVSIPSQDISIPSRQDAVNEIQNRLKSRESVKFDAIALSAHNFSLPNNLMKNNVF